MGSCFDLTKHIFGTVKQNREKDRHNKGTVGFIGETRRFPLLFNCRVLVELIGSRVFGRLIKKYEALHHGKYEIPPFR